MSERERDPSGYCGIDSLIGGFDRALRVVAGVEHGARLSPAAAIPESDMAADERRRAAALMRVNHAGEVCAQALYQGQALGARDAAVAGALDLAAREEENHLAWSAQRIRELGGRTSLLTPFWYAGAFGIGAISARLGKRWNLAFLAETERQVAEHLSGHLERLPAADERTRSVIDAMRADESIHRQTAIDLGAAEMPAPARLAMRLAAKVMTVISYRI